MQILQRYDEKKIVVGVLMKEWMKRFCPQKVLEKQYLFRSSVRFQLVFVFWHGVKAKIIVILYSFLFQEEQWRICERETEGCCSG